MTITISGTTGIAGVDGSAGTPVVQGTDGNTGVFYPAADTVGVSTGGSERMRVDSSGNVGIGKSSPASRLHVQGGNGTGGITNPSGTFAAIVSHNQDGSGLNGLSVSNRWAASTSTVFELAAGWNGSATGYYPFFRYDGIGQRFSSIYGTVGSSSGTTLYPEFQCRAWVNFNGTGTVAIRSSGNVTSITDNGVGDYTVNFTTAMPDASYSWALACNGNAGGMQLGAQLSGTATSPTLLSTSQIRFNTGATSGGTNIDMANVSAIFFR